MVHAYTTRNSQSVCVSVHNICEFLSSAYKPYQKPLPLIWLRHTLFKGMCVIQFLHGLTVPAALVNKLNGPNISISRFSPTGYPFTDRIKVKKKDITFSLAGLANTSEVVFFISYVKFLPTKAVTLMSLSE